MSIRMIKTIGIMRMQVKGRMSAQFTGTTSPRENQPKIYIFGVGTIFGVSQPTAAAISHGHGGKKNFFGGRNHFVHLRLLRLGIPPVAIPREELLLLNHFGFPRC